MFFFAKKFWACSLLFFSLYTSAQNKSNLDYVDPTIGGVGVILQPTRPTVHLPNSMVRVFPNREDHLDDQISNFQLTITSHRLFKVFAFMPVSGGVNPVIWNQSFENGPEVLQPYYYKTVPLKTPAILLNLHHKKEVGFLKFNLPIPKTTT